MVDEAMGSITAIFQQLRRGDDKSAQQLWNRFFPRLLALARKVMAGRELPLGAEDAVQTAFFNFFRRVDLGKVDGDAHRDELWKLLSIATVQVAHKQRRREEAIKRGGGSTLLETDLVFSSDKGMNLDQLFGSINPPDCDLISEDLLNLLDDDLREIAILRLAGYTNVEIKDLVAYPLRSIERRVHLIREIWRAHVDQFMAAPDS